MKLFYNLDRLGLADVMFASPPHTQKKAVFTLVEKPQRCCGMSRHISRGAPPPLLHGALCHHRGGCWHASTQTNACCLYSRGRPLVFLTVALMLLCVTAHFCCIGRPSDCFLRVSTYTEPPETTVCSALLSLVSTKVYKARWRRHLCASVPVAPRDLVCSSRHVLRSTKTKLVASLAVAC